ncbi:SusC/RagA family TonB-linked outer membrane protein [Mucilaginibacter pallidiroseus]|uniref:SusC/RagA family TonB-linked outer membrane protein n=1 Tax=Mucilaginibacter pallidiroseus TaxID=2599295 RepID=A0A563UE52_9SPHI|nr:SusC/RagA family TonB-linked outer membrane protein [Mucilaginibacter pallidiroseus]TWR29647.1 SusC/RagA family TonB-linked outer membrane protein [Mucilaginibacter pallidiroseus]
MKNTLLKITALSAVVLLSDPALANAAVGFKPTLYKVGNNAAAVNIQKEITGTVVDDKGTPLPGVTVKNLSSGKAVVTDVNGIFRIDANADDTLSFTFIGFATQNQKAGQGGYTVKLGLASTSLDEVTVVSVGYGTKNLKEVTSATSHVGPEDFRQTGSRNPLDLIQGKVAGLQITRTSGSNPNSGVAVQLRGAVTVTGSASPLYVIDGIPGGNLDLLQQDDIESIDVLKDGAGAAIYGSTANAGVIIITTKKGRKGPPQFNYSSYIRKEYLNQRLKFLTPQQFRDRIASGDIRQQDFGSSTNFYDQLINHDNFSQNHNLALSGGSDKTNYRASINYRDLQGIAKENGRKDYTVRLNINQTGLNDRLKMQVNLATNLNNANLLGGEGFESELTKNPTLSNFNPDGTYRFDLTSRNELARLAQETNYRKQQTSSADVKADLTIIDGLTLSAFGSALRDNRVDGQYILKAGENSVENTDFPRGGYAARGTFLSQDYAFEPTIQYNRLFQGKHNVTVLGGYSYRYHIEEGFSASNRGFINDLFHEDNLGQGSALGLGKASMSSNKNDNTLVALFGRLNYSFNGKYLATVSIRREGSSRFGNNNKFGNFPAASAAWVVSEEDFLKNVTFINSLKIRGGYGETGNSGFANNASRVTLGGGGRYIYPDGQYLETYGPNRNPNPNLRFERKREVNIGTEFTMFNNRLSGTIDLFNRTVKDLLDTYTSPQPPYVQSNLYTNVGQISSKGIEVALSYAAIKKKDFSWDVDVTASTLKNTLDSYSNDEYKVLYKTFGGIGGAGDLGDAITTYEGRSLGEFWGKRFAGFTADGKWLFYNRNGEAISNTQINNSKDRNVTDLALIGNAVPKYYASLNNNFRYKNFNLRIFLRGKFDFDILNTTALSYANRTWSGNLLQSTFTKYAQINDTYQYSNYYIESGTYVKLDEVTLGYNFKLKTKYMNRLYIYFTGQNLATITGYTGSDPDYIQDTGTSPGVDSRSAYPSTRSFVFGVNVGF